MSGSASGAIRAKVERARFHADVFDDGCRAFLDSHPYHIIVHAEPDPPNWLTLTWGVRESPPIELALIFGDMLVNLRAALDYIVWQLVLVNGREPNTQHAFPCVRKIENWASARKQRLVGVAPDWVAEIEKLQPYHRQPNPERHLFAVLDAVNNINKHRVMSSIAVTMGYWSCGVGGDIAGRTLSFDVDPNRPVEDGTEIGRWRFDPPMTTQNVSVDTDPPFRIAFRDGLDHADGWTYINRDLVEWVERAVAIFEPAFAG